MNAQTAAFADLADAMLPWELQYISDMDRITRGQESEFVNVTADRDRQMPEVEKLPPVHGSRLEDSMREVCDRFPGMERILRLRLAWVQSRPLPHLVRIHASELPAPLHAERIFLKSVKRSRRL